MDLIADGLLMATAMIAGLYCLVLSRRLSRLTDSSSGIGSQIAALDRALTETRGALAETRKGVSELQASARAATAELKRKTESGQEMALSLKEATGKAESVLQRLYEVHERVEALDREATESARPRAPDGREEAASSTRRAIVLELDGQDGEPGSGPRERRLEGGKPARAGAPAGEPAAAEAARERASADDPAAGGAEHARAGDRKDGEQPT